MASRTSGMLLSETYQGTRRGRATSGDMGWEMFPEKTEVTDLEELPDQVYEDQRSALKDRSPDRNALFAEEETRRDTHARDFLQLRNFGSRSTTDPWISHGDFDIQFHDHDPRGYSDQQPWGEYRRLLEANRRRIDFKDDGDYSETSGAVHPNTLYRDIRSTQNWFKARFKNFSTSLEGRSNGGVGVYDNVSNVFKSESEDTSVKDDGMDATFEDPEIRQRTTMKLSNVVHLGSKGLRVNTTTDHRVPVAAYGKLYSNRGLLNHETQLRLIEDDTPQSRVAGLTTTPRNLARLMSQYVHDADYANGNFGDGRTAASAARHQAHNTAGDKGMKEGMRGDSAVANNRSQKLTADILALVGITEQEVKWAQSLEASNPKHSQILLANMMELVEMVQKLPIGERIKVRDELLLKSRGVVKGDLQNSLIQSEVVINPSLIRQMQQAAIGHGSRPDDETGALREVEADRKVRPETPVYITKSMARDTEDIVAAGHNVVHQTKVAAHTAVASKNYAQMQGVAIRIQENRAAGQASQVEVDTTGGDRDRGKTLRPRDADRIRNMRSAVGAQDITESGAPRLSKVDRPKASALPGSMRRYQQSDYVNPDSTTELSGVPARKSPWKLNQAKKTNVSFAERAGYTSPEGDVY